jgi:uncharacterized protein DUF3592
MTRVVIFGLVFAGVGALLAAIAWRLRRRHRDEIATLVEGTGVVIRIEASDVDGQRMYQPVVALDGREILDTTFHGASTWNVGDAHVVFYDSANPADARLSRETGSLFGAQLFGMVGVVVLMIGLIALASHVVGGAFGAFVRDALAYSEWTWRNENTSISRLSVPIEITVGSITTPPTGGGISLVSVGLSTGHVVVHDQLLAGRS